jgi:tetratricopeptide (TPR) repeat protein
MLADAGNLGDVGGTAYALYVLGLALHDLGRYQEAARRYRECLALAATAGRRAREAQAHLRLAETLRSLRSPAEAVREAETALRICAEAGYEQDRAHALGRALADLGHHQDCLLRLEEAQAIFRRLGLPDAADVAALLHDLVRLAQDSGGRAPLPVADA